MTVKKQIEEGIIVCPITKNALVRSSNGKLLKESREDVYYRLENGVIPILLENPEWAETYIQNSPKMLGEYSAKALALSKSLFAKIKSVLFQDYGSEQYHRALQMHLDSLSEETVNLSIGGGPKRIAEHITNLNIGLFPNVDVVGDAHALPYADDSLDFIHSDAVFEHLYDPVKAANEMYRTLKKGKYAFVCTPFMQAYHGYPHHYQNYTITGHRQLFQSVGFKVVESDVCVGPIYTIVDINAAFLNEYLPFPLNKVLKRMWQGFGIAIKPFDKLLVKKSNSFKLASTTYIILEK